MIDLAQLHCFQVVAEAGNFTRGAEKLLISQPAVSKQIASLEQRLGLTLIERGRRRFVLTEPGRTLLGYAQRIFSLADEAEQALSDLTALRRGRLRLGATPTIGTYLVPQTLVYFRQRFPDIEVSITVQDAASLGDRLRDGALDAIVTTAAIKDPALQRTEVGSDFIVAVRAGRSKSSKTLLTLGDLRTERIIVRSGVGNESGYVERMLHGRRAAPREILRLPHTESVKQAVLAGLGIGFVPQLAIARELKDGSLSTIAVKGFSLRRPLLWIERGLEKRTKAAQAYFCVLKHAARGSLPPAKI